MAKRVTLQDIARQLGLHHTSISRALGNSPKISASMRERIQQVAREMGYEPIPAAKALAVHRSGIRPVGEYGTLAWITQGAVPVFPDADYPYAGYVQGALTRAKELGFQLEEFPHRAGGMTDARLSAILKSRGIRGVLVAPWVLGTHMIRRLRLDWSAFSAVGFGHGLLWPPIPRVSNNQFRSMRLIVRELFALGYRRIGAYLPAGGVDRNWEAGFRLETEGKTESAQLLEFETYDFSRLEQWIKLQKMEVLITSHEGGANELQRLFPVPERLGVAACHVDSRNSEVSGIYQNFTYTGARAVDLLVSFLHANQRGIPEFPERILIEGEWVPGKTLRRLN